MNKLEALKYVCENFDGYDGGYQFSILRDMILEDKETYFKDDLDSLIKDMEDY